jgi:hypothetical protein
MSILRFSYLCACKGESGSTPEARDRKVKGKYPWGTEWNFLMTCTFAGLPAAETANRRIARKDSRLTQTAVS